MTPLLMADMACQSIIASNIIHLKVFSDWTVEESQLGRNLVISLGTAAAFAAIESLNGLTVGYCPSAFLLVPLALKATLYVLDKRGVDHNSRLYFEVDYANSHWDRYAQVVNMVALAALSCLGAPMVGWVAAAIISQFIAFQFANSYDEKRQTLLSASSYVRRNATLDVASRESCTRRSLEPIKPYYHILTIANENMSESGGTIHDRAFLLRWIQDLDKLDLSNPKDLSKYEGAVNFVFELENLQSSYEKDLRLGTEIVVARAQERHSSNLDPRGKETDTPSILSEDPMKYLKLRRPEFSDVLDRATDQT